MTTEATPGALGSNDQLGLLARLQSLKVLLGTDAPEVRGWAPVVQQGAQATVNAAIAALREINGMSERLEQSAGKLADENERLSAALQWYADGLHFDKASPDAWDTVSGEPQNWWCDEAGTATVEDGSIAAMTLRGELTAAQIQALD